MARPPASPRTWTDSELKDAIAASANWRQVMRGLGLKDNSAGLVRRVKRDTLALGIDTSHFRGKRSWSDGQLRRAVIAGFGWTDVLAALGLSPDNGDGRTRVKAHAIRLGLDLTHLEDPATTIEAAPLAPDLEHLREAATALAATWFVLCGCNAAFPVEPAVYDLLVTTPEGIKSVQVKTTTCYTKDGWQVAVGRRPYSVGNMDKRVPYDPEVIDLFFIVDGDLSIYLIPSRVIAGRVGITLRTYKKYIVGNARGLMVPRRSNVA